jgi:hypothetical protein
LKLKKSFIPQLFNTAKEKVFKWKNARRLAIF